MQRSTTRTKCWAVTSVPETTPEPSPSECSGHWPRASPYTPRRERPRPGTNSTASSWPSSRPKRPRTAGPCPTTVYAPPTRAASPSWRTTRTVTCPPSATWTPTCSGKAATNACGRPWARAFAATTTRWAAPTVLPATRSWAPRSPSGRPTRTRSAWSATSTPGTAAATPCANSVPRASGRSSSPASRRARSTSTSCSTRTTSGR